VTDPEVIKWRKAGRYLPAFMRDFHHQKDLFKALHDTVAVEKHEYCKDISWSAGQCYVIDIFLWHMARHGYVLRRADKKLPFDDIYATTKKANDRARAGMASALGLTPLKTEQP
jgi:hypothetical protein